MFGVSFNFFKNIRTLLIESPITPNFNYASKTWAIAIVVIEKLHPHTSHNGDLARMNFRLKNDNTIDLDYPCALQNTLVFGL